MIKFCVFLELLDRIFKRKHGSRYFKVYKNEDDFYAFELPVEWNHIETSDLYGRIFSDSQILEGKIMIKTVDSFYQDFDEYLNDLVGALEKHNNYRITSKEKIKITGHDALEAEFQAQAMVGKQSVDAIVKNIIINDKTRERFVSITFSILARDYGKYKIIYQRLRKTFKFLA